jgi:hypothetical protein
LVQLIGVTENASFVVLYDGRVTGQTRRYAMSHPAQFDNSAASHWGGFYKACGAAALLTTVFILIQMVVFVVWPPPETVTGFFELYHSHPLLGFLSLDLLYVIDNVLLIPILLGLYLSLRKINEPLMLTASLLGFIGVTCLFASNPCVNMYTLSGQYAAAAAEAQRALYLAAGETLLAGYTGTAYHLSLILGSVALVLIGIVMLKSRVYGKAAAILCIAANALALGLYVPTVGKFILLFSIIFLWVFYLLITIRFFRLGSGLEGG